MVKGKDLQQAPVFTIEMDKARKITFDFNALVELGEYYDDPYTALDKLEHANPKVLRHIVYAMLVAGEKIKDEDAELDLSLSEVGHLVGQWFRKKEKLQEVMVNISKGVEAFFRDTEDDEKTDEKKDSTDKGQKAEKN